MLEKTVNIMIKGMNKSVNKEKMRKIKLLLIASSLIVIGVFAGMFVSFDIVTIIHTLNSK